MKSRWFEELSVKYEGRLVYCVTIQGLMGHHFWTERLGKRVLNPEYFSKYQIRQGVVSLVV